MSSSRLQGFVLFALACVVYGPALGCGFVWDDDTFLTRNPLIHAPDGLWRFWFTAEAPDFFPLTSSMLWLEWRLWGGNPAGFHAVNVLLHATSAVLLWRVLSRLEVMGAWFGAALFAVHPVTVESVAWITERKNTLSLALTLAALLQHLRWEDGVAPRRSYLASIGLFVAALLAKTAAVVLAPILLVLAWFRRGAFSGRDIVAATPHFLAAGVLGFVTLWFQMHNAIDDTLVRDDGWLSRTAIAGRAVWFYLGKALAPVGLSFVYPRWETGDVSASAFLPLALLVIAAIVIALSLHSTGRGPLTAFACYVLALAPTLGFADVFFMRYSLVADHWQYFALPAFTALVGGAWFRYTDRHDRTSWRWPPVLLVLAVFGWATWREQARFRDVESLWKSTIESHPDAWMAHSNLGLLLAERGELEQAAECMQRAVLVEPDRADLRYNLGQILQRQRKHDLAAAQFEYALERELAHASARNGLGLARLSMGRVEQALSDFEAASALDPTLASAHANVGQTLLALGRFEESLPHFEEALKLRPDYIEALANHGSALHELGRFAEAAERHRRVVQLAPRNPAAHFNLGNALRELGRADEAIAEYSQALALDASYAGARFHLAGLLLAKGRAREAFEHYERLLPDEPGAAHLLEAMERAAAASSEPEEAAKLRVRLEAARGAPR